MGHTSDYKLNKTLEHGQMRTRDTIASMRLLPPKVKHGLDMMAKIS